MQEAELILNINVWKMSQECRFPVC